MPSSAESALLRNVMSPAPGPNERARVKTASEGKKPISFLVHDVIPSEMLQKLHLPDPFYNLILSICTKFQIRRRFSFYYDSKRCSTRLNQNGHCMKKSFFKRSTGTRSSLADNSVHLSHKQPYFMHSEYGANSLYLSSAVKLTTKNSRMLPRPCWLGKTVTQLSPAAECSQWYPTRFFSN